jgi:anti-sigma B factor antagonist
MHDLNRPRRGIGSAAWRWRRCPRSAFPSRWSRAYRWSAPEEIDVTNAAALLAAVSEAIEPGSALVIVDMSRTRFCDSAGLNALVAADRRARAEGGEVRLVIVAEAIVRVVALTGVDRVVPIYASLEEAFS